MSSAATSKGGAKKRASSAKNADAAANHADDMRRETPLQAVVFADSFATTFRPITLECPKVLMPLANVPMLEYTLELLACSGVEDVILFCTSHAEIIERYVAEQSRGATRVHVRCVASPQCATQGDALRELDQQQVVQSDPFVLVTGDVVANVNLVEILSEHQARKKADANAIMTSIFKQVPNTTSANAVTSVRGVADDLVVALDAETKQIVLYEDHGHRHGHGHGHGQTALGAVFLDEHAQIEVRTDLMDCGLDICSLDVLQQFSGDYVDYQDLRHDYLHNEAQDYELGSKFFAKIVTEPFAARVIDPRTYSGITHALLQRWAFPMVPDSNFLSPEPTTYAYHRGMIYREDDVTLSRTCAIERESIIGAKTSIGDHSVVASSALGRHCSIGKNVRIQGSFVWNNVVIEDDVTITNAIICDRAVIRKGAVIEEGCIVSYGVVVGAGFRLAAFSKVTTALQCKQDADDDEFGGFGAEEEAEETRSDANEPSLRKSSLIDWDPKHVGVGGVGRLWTLDDDEIDTDSDDDANDADADEQAAAIAKATRRLVKLKITMPGAADVVFQCAHKHDNWDTLSSDDEDNDGNLLDDELEAPAMSFQDSLRETVVRGDTEGSALDDLFVDIKGFKFAQNKSFADVLHAIIPGLLDVVALESDAGSAMALLAQVRAKFDKWSSVVKRCLVEDADQLAVVEALEQFCLDDKQTTVWLPLFRFLLQIAYDLEWASEDTVLQWHATRMDASWKDAKQMQLAKSEPVQEFIDWLQDEDEEEDSDDDEDDEEEEDE